MDRKEIFNDQSLFRSENRFRIDVSHAGGTERKNKSKRKDFSGTSRMACSKRSYTGGRIGVLFTLHGIHSSPVKRVKTQKSESLFVTSFDVAINSFEVTAGYTGRNIRQLAAVRSEKFKFPANCCLLEPI